MKSRLLWVFVLALIGILPFALYGQATSRVIPFVAVPTSLPTETVQAVTVQLWDAAVEGTMLFSEPRNVDVDANGRISFLFGDQMTEGLDPAHFPSGSSRFVDVVDSGGVSVLVNRMALTATAFALSPGPQGPQGQPGPEGPRGLEGPPGQAGVIQTLAPADTSVTVGGTPADRTVAVADGGVGTAKLANAAVTSAKLAPGAVTAASIGVPLFLSSETSGDVLSAINTGTGNGVAGRGGSPSGSGLMGLGGAPNGAGIVGGGMGLGTGVTGFGGNSSSAGVFGQGGAPNGRGIEGFGLGTGEGVLGVGGLSSGTGVVGEGGSNSGTGMLGRGGTPNGTGMIGAGLGAGDGVSGVGGNNNGVGVRGRGHSAGGLGVYGLGTGVYDGVRGQVGAGGGTASGGVHGISDAMNGNGVIGEAHNGTLAYGVYGLSFNGFAGYFQGRVNVTGMLTKGGGAFRIDHPLDPANKYLSHSFVESPDMMNIHNGIVVLDGEGQAVVELPAWFGALNRDFRYQLTAVGAPGPNLYIAEKVANNRFKIAGGAGGMEVSWQVTGIRQDAWANAHRIPVEEDKPADERGFYLHPEVFGAPEEKGMDWARKPEFMKRMKEEHAQRAARPQP